MARSPEARVSTEAVADGLRHRSVTRATASLREMVSDLGWWPLVPIIFLAMLFELPHLIAVAQDTRGHVFVGMFWAPHDVSQYLAAMRDGAAGAWLVTDHLSGEPHAPAMIYPLYAVLGKLAVAAGIGIERAYQLAGSAARIVLLVAIYAVTGLVSQRPARRQLAFLLIAVSSGMTSFLAVLLYAVGIEVDLAGAEFNVPEVSTFLVFFTAPHLMLALALLFGIARSVVAACNGGLAGVWLTAAFVVILGFTNSFSLATVCAVLGVFGAVQFWRGALTRHGFAAIAGAFLAAGPFILYTVLVFTPDPFWGETYGRQNKTLTHPPLDLLMGYGLLAPLAALGAREFVRQPTPGRLLVLTWIVVSAVLMYLPVGFQRRFSYGLHPMLALAAAYGLPLLWRQIRMARPPVTILTRTVGTTLLGQALFGSTMFLYVFTVFGALGPSRGWVTEVDAGADRAAFQPLAMQQAGQRLAQRVGPGEIVLGHTISGNLLAGMIRGRVYAGHWVATLDFARKEREVRWFYSGSLDADRVQFLRDQGIRYVVYGPYERALGAQIPLADDQLSEALALVEETDGVRVYAVRHAATAVAPRP